MSTKVNVEAVLSAVVVDKSVKELSTELNVTGATVKKHLKTLVGLGCVAKTGVRKVSNASGRGRPYELFKATGSPLPTTLAGVQTAQTV